MAVGATAQVGVADASTYWTPTGTVDATTALALVRELGLVTVANVVGGLVVTDVSRRNRNYRIVTTDGPSFLIKQADDADKARTLNNEAQIYEVLTRHASATVRAGLPHVVRYLPKQSVLILDIDPDAMSLATYHRRTRRFPTGVASALGRSLAALHATAGEDAHGVMPVVDSLPLVFSFDCPDVTIYYGASFATLQLFTAVHSSGNFAELLGRLRQEWRAECIIHADVRLDNCIVHPGVPARTGKRLRLVDWEMARWGDPAWDVATVLSEYLSLWLDHAPVSELTPPEQFLDHGRFTLERWQPFVQQFWSAYSSDEPATAGLWWRTVRFTAVRLVQRAYESTQFDTELSGQVVLKLQLAHNLLIDPVAAARTLFGIAP